MKKIKSVCEANDLKLHLDGARLFNALVAKNETPQQYGEIFDTISICLNKGLGCPIGSILLGSADFIKRSRRTRKVFGGGMRQAGFMAASGIYALQHHVNRLREDHEHAQAIANVLATRSFTAGVLPVETNIIIFEVKDAYKPAAITAMLKEKNILAIPFSPTQIRMVLHLDITPKMVDEVIETIKSL